MIIYIYNPFWGLIWCTVYSTGRGFMSLSQMSDKLDNLCSVQR